MCISSSHIFFHPFFFPRFFSFWHKNELLNICFYFIKYFVFIFLRKNLFL